MNDIIKVNINPLARSGGSSEKCMEALQLQVSQHTSGPEWAMDEIERFCRGAKLLKNWTKSGQEAK